MATRTITENVNQAVQDFDNIKQAIIDKGIEVPNGTPTSEYADKIGTIKINGLDTSTVTDFSNFAQKDRFGTGEILTGLNTKSGTNFYGMFENCTSLTTIPQLNTSNGTNFYGMFKNCTSLTTIPQLNTSNGTSFYGMFSNCKSLTTVELTSFISSNGMFYYCLALENLTVTGTITVNNNDLSLSDSPKLTVDSLMSVINALSDNTGGTTYTVTLGATNLAKLTDEQKQIAIDKNYTLA